MRIAIDARALSDPQPSGFKTYVECLVSALVSAKDHTYLLYVDRPLPVDLAVGDPEVVAVTYPSSVLKFPMREQISLPRRIWKDRPDMVHFPCNTAPLWCNRPYVVTVHDLLQFQSQFAARRRKQRAVTRYCRMTIQRAVSKAAYVITVSQWSRSQLIERFCLEPGRVVVVYQGVREIFHSTGSAPFSPKRTRPEFLLALGSSDRRKNLPLLLDAYARLPADARRQVPLVIVCSHRSVPDELGPMASKAGVKPHYLYDVDDTTLAGLYRASTAFVFPSLAEGFGLPPIEAMACGTPVVAVRSAAALETLGSAAVLVDGSDASTLATALLNVLEDPNLRMELTRRGLERAAQFTWTECAAKTADVYGLVADQGVQLSGR